MNSLLDIINNLVLVNQKYRVCALLDENHVTDIYFQELINLAEIKKYEVDFLSINKIYNFRPSLYDFFIAERHKKINDIYAEFHIWHQAINPGGFLVDLLTGAEEYPNLTSLSLPGYQKYELNLSQSVFNKIGIYRKNIE